MGITRRGMAVAAAWLGLAGSAYAIPNLQLGIAGGYYNGCANETTCAADGATSFKVYAYLITNASNLLSDTYFISVALAPKTSSPDTNGGSFVANGTTVDVTADMSYGVPPIDTVATQLSDPGDLSDHGIYDTYFWQHQFQFSSLKQVTQFNVQDAPYHGADPTTMSGTGMYYYELSIDAANLNPLREYQLHFDLYNSKVCTGGQGQCDLAGDVDITEFAPYSHDAQSSFCYGGDCDHGNGVPEPAALALLSVTALAGGVASRRRRPARSA